MSRLLRLALEEEPADGKARREIEYTFYGRMIDLGQLDHAHDFEMHEQWEIRIAHTEANAGSGRIRVRKTQKTISDVPLYVQTSKTEYNGDGDRIEISLPSSAEGFQQFQILAESGMMKDRYIFRDPDSGLEWHLDMHYIRGSHAGEKKYCQWCRLELEVPKRGIPLPPLPVQLEDLITNQRNQQTEEEGEKIKALYAHDFILPNPHKL